jgi:hypothetical protein
MNRWTCAIVAILGLVIGCSSPDAPSIGDDEIGGSDDEIGAEPPASPACMTDAQEPNDSVLSATPVHDFDLLAGSLCPDDEDWFTFTISQPTYAGISARYDGRHGDLDFELFGPPGNIAALANGDDIQYHTIEAVHQRLFLPGTYTVRLYLDAGQGEVAYKLRLYLLPQHG